MEPKLYVGLEFPLFPFEAFDTWWIEILKKYNFMYYTNQQRCFGGQSQMSTHLDELWQIFVVARIRFSSTTVGACIGSSPNENDFFFYNT